MRYGVSIGLIVLGIAATCRGGAAAPNLPDAAWVEQRIQQWQPTARERRWESIGWAPGLREALRLAKENRRPVFLFTHDGRLNVGRC
jgi:hypothetical protein